MTTWTILLPGVYAGVPAGAPVPPAPDPEPPDESDLEPVIQFDEELPDA